MSEHTIPADAVNPALVPQRTLYTGAKMPGLGIGTFGSDRFTAEDIANAVEDAKVWIVPLKNFRRSKKLLHMLIDILSESDSRLARLKMKTGICFMRF